MKKGKKIELCNIRKWGDLAAIPMFILVIYYILNKKMSHKNKKEEYEYTFTEKIILLFAIVGLIADSVFSLEYLFYNHKC